MTSILRAKKNNGIPKFKLVMEKLQKSLTLVKKSSFWNNREFEQVADHSRESPALPKDVKEGHFAVIAVDDGKPKRFVVPLCCLNHPTFLMLLEQAAEEFGFNHEGALTIPCRWSELERISC